MSVGLPRGLPLKETEGLLIGIDVGATKVAACTGHATGAVITQATFPTVRGSPEELLHQLDAITTQLVAETKQAIGSYSTIALGVGICGGVNSSGEVHSPIALGWPDPVPLKQLLAEQTGLPTFVENDVNAGALGELYWGEGKSLQNFVYVSLGTGIGAGLVLNRRLYRGSNWLAGELGHVTIDVNGRRCACGNLGCIEACAGGRALAVWVRDDLQRTREAAATGLQTQLDPAMLTAKDIIIAAQSGDRYAQHVIEELGDQVAAVIAGLFNLLDPDKIIMAGGLLQTDSIVMTSITNALNTWKPLFGSTHGRVVRAGLGLNAGAVGAMAVALNGAAQAEEEDCVGVV